MARTIKAVLDELEQRCDINIEDCDCFAEAAYVLGYTDEGEKHKNRGWAFKCVKRWIGEVRQTASQGGEE